MLYLAQPFLPHNDDANESHNEGGQGGIRRPRAQVQQSSREPPTAVSRVPPPPHVRILAKFIRLLPLASYCVDATERRASAAPKATEIHKTRNPRPFTGFFFGLYMHPNRPLDLKIVFNQHPKPPNGITNVFCIGGRSGPVNFLFPFPFRVPLTLEEAEKIKSK